MIDSYPSRPEEQPDYLPPSAAEEGGGEDQADARAESLAAVYRRQAQLPPSARQATGPPVPLPEFRQDGPQVPAVPMPEFRSATGDKAVPLPEYDIDRDEAERQEPSGQQPPARRPDGQLPPGRFKQTIWNGPRRSEQEFLIGDNGQVEASGGAGGEYLADPQKQYLVKQAEDALTAFQGRDDVDPTQKEGGVRQLQKQIDDLDPHKVYRKGGMLSQQTAAQKWLAQNLYVDEARGVAYFNDGKGWKAHNLPDRHTKEAEIVLAKLRVQEQHIKNQAAADQRAHDAGTREREHFDKRIGEHEKILFGHEDRAGFVGTKTSQEKRTEAALDRERKLSVEHRLSKGPLHQPKTADEARKLYDDVYAYLHAGKPQPQGGEELRKRHQAVIDYLDRHHLRPGSAVERSRQGPAAPQAPAAPPLPDLYRRMMDMRKQTTREGEENRRKGTGDPVMDKNLEILGIKPGG